MIQKIVTAGCSFTYGEELDDLTQCWPQQLANKLKCDNLVNLAEPAASNDKMVRKIIDHLSANSADLVVIGWSMPGRSEYADEFGYYDVWPGYSGKLFVKDGTEWRKELVDYFNRYHNSEAIHRKWMHQVLMMQGLLNDMGIKYIMLSVVQNDYYKKRIFENYELLVDKVNKERFIDFGISGMLEWTHGVPQGKGGHFLVEGHQIVANRVYEHIRNLGWLS